MQMFTISHCLFCHHWELKVNWRTPIKKIKMDFKCVNQQWAQIVLSEISHVKEDFFLWPFIDFKAHQCCTLDKWKNKKDKMKIEESYMNFKKPLVWLTYKKNI